MPNKKLIVSLEDLTNLLREGATVEEALSLIFRVLQKNYAISSSSVYASISQATIEKELMESIVDILVKHLRELKTTEVIKITPLLGSELFEIVITTQEEVNDNVNH